MNVMSKERHEKREQWAIKQLLRLVKEPEQYEQVEPVQHVLEYTLVKRQSI